LDLFQINRTTIVQINYICMTLKLLLMASVNFLYRSTKPKAYLNLRLLYRINSDTYNKGYKDFVIGGKTQIEVTKIYWIKEHLLTRFKRTNDIEELNKIQLLKEKQSEINSELNKLEGYILNMFNSTKPDTINKKWLQNQINKYYNPTKDNNNNKPEALNEYLDYYIEGQKAHVSLGTYKKSNVIKQMLVRFQDNRNKTLLMKDINLDFKNEFESYCLEMGYAYNTIARAIKFSKTVSRHAYSQGVETSRQLDSIKTKTKESHKIHLTHEELDKIRKKKFKEPHLQNARDWLIISCYSGQRISDFMRFKKEMIRKAGEKYLIDFKQIKTGKVMTIPLLKEVRDVLEIRNGDFPKLQPDQKYNKHIKTVCRRAGIKEEVLGSLKVKVSEKQYRHQTKHYEKWKLITSHIGRRSFATNYYGEVPISHLKTITGHTTEHNFIAYLVKGDEEKAIDASKYFD